MNGAAEPAVGGGSDFSPDKSLPREARPRGTWTMAQERRAPCPRRPQLVRKDQGDLRPPPSKAAPGIGVALSSAGTGPLFPNEEFRVQVRTLPCVGRLSPQARCPISLTLAFRTHKMGVITVPISRAGVNVRRDRGYRVPRSVSEAVVVTPSSVPGAKLYYAPSGAGPGSQRG